MATSTPALVAEVDETLKSVYDALYEHLPQTERTLFVFFVQILVARHNLSEVQISDLREEMQIVHTLLGDL